jgi:hypothetical protein
MTTQPRTSHIKLGVLVTAVISSIFSVIMTVPHSSYASVNGNDDDCGSDLNCIAYKLASPCVKAQNIDSIDEDFESESKTEGLEMCHSSMLYLKGQCEGTFRVMENFCNSGGEMMVDDYLEFYNIEDEPRPDIPSWIENED